MSEKLPELDITTLLNEMAAPKDSKESMWKSYGYLQNLKRALPDLVAKSLPENVHTVKDALEDDEWIVNLVMDHMKISQRFQLAIFLPRLPGFDLLGEDVSHRVRKEEKTNMAYDPAKQGDMMISLVADYSISLILLIEPSILEKALDIKNSKER